MTSIQRYEEPRTEITEHQLVTWQRQANILAKSPLVPDHFRNKPDDIVVAFLGLHEMGVQPGPNKLQKCYVVKGKPGYMAQLQIAVASRAGWDIRPIDELCNDGTATVRIRRRGSDEAWEQVTFTMADAVKAKLPEQNPCYRTYPSAMLFARAVTRAIGRYCPGVLLGLEGTADYVEYEQLAGAISAPAPDLAPGGDESVGADTTTPQEPVAGSWRDRAAAAGLRQADLIRQARAIAGELDIDPPLSLEAITAPELCERLDEWLAEESTR